MIELSIAKKLFSASGEMNLQLNLTIQRGELVTLYGHSGAGKTSTLRMIAGLLTPDEGKIVVNGNTWFDKKNKINLKTQSRNLGMVFQDYALFPTMTVRGNISYALEKGQPKEIIDELLQLMELHYLAEKKPVFLSGGQRQRVALARALVRKPTILLLDEPLSALNTTLRLKMQEYILNVHKQYQLTTILISHDIAEVLRLSGKIFVLENGEIIKQGAPHEVLPLQDLRDMLSLLDANLPKR